LHTEQFYYRLEDTPSGKGTYLLRLVLEQRVEAIVGKLGEAVFEPGTIIIMPAAHWEVEDCAAGFVII
jgi:hypothetical protein